MNGFVSLLGVCVHTIAKTNLNANHLKKGCDNVYVLVRDETKFLVF